MILTLQYTESLGVRLHSFTHGNPVVPKPFAEETILFLKGLFYLLSLCAYDVLGCEGATTATWRSEDVSRIRGLG